MLFGSDTFLFMGFTFGGHSKQFNVFGGRWEENVLNKENFPDPPVTLSMKGLLYFCEYF